MRKNQYLPIQSKHRVLADSQLYIAMLHTQFMALLKKYQQLLIIFKEKKYNSYFFGEQMKFPKVVLCALAVGDKCLSTCIRYFILAIWRC